MVYDPQQHNRQSLRMPGYDYSQPGAYFITICTEGKINRLGQIVCEQIVLNEIGIYIDQVWKDLYIRFPTIQLDQYVIMPNHFHGIIVLVGAGLALPSEGTASRTPTLGSVIGAFKSISTIGINKLLTTPGRQFWQKNYYEHIIRTEDELNNTCEYIVDNPLKWENDEENPNARPL